jgi:hypothetical protein
VSIAPRALVACAVLSLLARVAVADPSTAAAAYRQAEELAKQGKLAEACPFYAASFKEDPQLGALLHLADCNEKIGKTATAWAEWNDAAELAHQRNDKREATARARAAALAGKLAHLHINAPKVAIPGLSVQRDGEFVTIFVGTDMPIDPGEHEIAAEAAGYKPWSTKIKIEPSTNSSVDIPALEKLEVQPVEPPEPVVREGHITIVTDPKADIYLDAEKVGTGRYEGSVRAGGHTLRISAEGMRSYQSEIVVGDGDKRVIDVPLERAVAPVVVVPGRPEQDGPSVELALGLGAGAKLRNDNPAVASARLEIALRIGRRVNFGLYTELGNISTGNACGFDMPGPTPATPYDYSQRLQFNSCRYVMPGLQLLVHILPGRKIDPYVGITPGFRFGFATWTPYTGDMPQAQVETWFPAIVTGFRAGVNYQVHPELENWVVGGFVEDLVTIIADEAPEQYRTNDGPVTFYQWLVVGIRSTVAF